MMMNYYPSQVSQSQQQSVPAQPPAPPPSHMQPGFVPPLPQQQRPQQPPPSAPIAQHPLSQQQYAALHQQQIQYSPAYHQQQYVPIIPYQTAGINQQVYVEPPIGAANVGAQPPPLNPTMHSAAAAAAAYNFHHPQLLMGQNFPQQQYYFPSQPVYSSPPPPIAAQEQRSNSILSSDSYMTSAASMKKEEVVYNKTDGHEFMSVNTLEQNMMRSVLHDTPPQTAEHNASPIVSTPKPSGPAMHEFTATSAGEIAPPTTTTTLQQQHNNTGDVQTHARCKPSSPATAPEVEQRSTNSPLWRTQRSTEKIPRKRTFSSICYYCKLKGKPEAEFNNHSTIDNNNVVTCPLLRSNGCQICGKAGDEAHSEIHCPTRKEENNNFAQFASEIVASFNGPSRFGGGSMQGGSGGHGYHHSGGGGPRNTYTNSQNRSGGQRSRKN